MRNWIAVMILVALSYTGQAQGCDSLRRAFDERMRLDSATLERYLDHVADLTVKLRTEQKTFEAYRDNTAEFALEFGKLKNQRTIYLSTSAAGVAGVLLVLLLRR